MRGTMRGRRRRACMAAGLAWAAAWLAPEGAAANGRAPNTTGIALQAGNPARAMAAMTFGLALTTDGGQTWHWVCEDAFGGVTSSSVDAGVAITGAGDLVVAVPTGLFVSRDAGCSFGRVGDFNSAAPVTSVVAHPQRPATFLVTTNSTTRFSGELLVTDDGGQTFRTAYSAGAGVMLYAAAVAPSNPDVMVVAGSNNAAADSCFLFHSEDGGASWAGGVVPQAPGAAQTPAVAISPVDPRIVLLASLDLNTRKSTVLRSTDGGKTFAVSATVDGELRGVVFSGDGAGAAVGTVYNVSISDDGGVSFVPTDKPTANGCAAASGNTLWACGNEKGDGFSVGALPGESQAWEARLLLSNLQGPYHCAPGTPVRDTCMPLWAPQAGIIGAPAEEQPKPGSAPKGRGCGGCQGSAAAGSELGGVLALASLVRARRRQRPRARR
jgi:photosystem II stability/assembly factor-like uncharacterized protein